MKNNVKWMWCQKCAQGKGRWSTTHNTSNHDPEFYEKKKKLAASKGKVNSTADTPEEPTLGVWCTAIESHSMILMYILFGISIGLFAAFKGCQVMKTINAQP